VYIIGDRGLPPTVAVQTGTTRAREQKQSQDAQEECAYREVAL
jgi:hypothetical protein